MSAETLDAATALARLGIAHPGWTERLGRLPGAPVTLPAGDDALFERLGLTAKDATALGEGWPSPAWPAELRWLLERVVAHLRRDLGGYGLVEPGPPLARDGSPARRYFAVYALLGLLEDVRRYHAARGVPEEISWATLADLGRNLVVDRRTSGERWEVIRRWLTLHFRGGVYELGRLQFQRGRWPAHCAPAPGAGAQWALNLHVPESGPLIPAACDASFARAAHFFRRCFPDEPYRRVVCESWLLDPQLGEYLPEDANIMRFQRRFQLLAGGTDANVDVLSFVFHAPHARLEALRPRTTLERAVQAHLAAGRTWQTRCGWLSLQ